MENTEEKRIKKLTQDALDYIISKIDSCAADDSKLTEAYNLVKDAIDALPEPNQTLVKIYMPTDVYELPEVKEAFNNLSESLNREPEE